MMHDYMELGNSSLVPLEGDWFLDKTTGKRFRIDEDGNVFNEAGTLINKQDDSNE